MSTGSTAEAYAIGDDVAARMSTALKALADPLRLRMLSLLAASPSGEVTAGDLASLTDVSQPTVSHHLKVLRDVGVLSAERRGTWVWYRITTRYRAAVGALLDAFAPAATEPDATAARPVTGLADVDRELERVAESLAQRVGTSPAEALRVVRESYTALARRGGLTVHLVALTEHFAHQRLADAARPQSDASGAAKPHVLFVCVGNAGRSQLAAALLRHHAGDRVVVRSAGSAPARDVHAPVREILAQLGQDSPDAFPKPLTDDAVRAADVVVTMGCGDRVPLLPGKRYEDWAVGDPALASPAGVRAIRDDLDARVRTLLAELAPDLRP